MDKTSCQAKAIKEHVKMQKVFNPKSFAKGTTQKEAESSLEKYFKSRKKK